MGTLGRVGGCARGIEGIFGGTIAGNVGITGGSVGIITGGRVGG